MSKIPFPAWQRPHWQSSNEDILLQFYVFGKFQSGRAPSLDYGSEGLLLMTNDGALAQKLTKAGSHVPKTYLVKINGKPAATDIACLRAGVTIELDDGRRVKTSPASIQLVDNAPNPWYEVTLIEGRNRQIRRMFAVVGFQVEKIKRTKIGPLKLDVEPGKFRALTVREVAQLKAL